MLRHYVGPYHDDWDAHLCMVEFAINNSLQASILTTPFRAVYGYDPHTPVSACVVVKCPAAQKLWGTCMERAASCKAALIKAQQRQKHYYDQGRRAVTFALGDEVLLSTRNVQFKCTGKPKFLPRYVGPYRVLQLIGPLDADGVLRAVTAVKLDLPSAMRVHPVFMFLLSIHIVEMVPTGFSLLFILTLMVPQCVRWSVLWTSVIVDMVVLPGRKTFTAEHDTWEPSSAVQEGAPQVVDAWNLLLARRDRRDRRGLEVPGGSTRRRGLQGSR
jgi:hypothetical protein